MAKFTTLFMIALLLSPSMLIYAAARPEPSSIVKTQNMYAEMEKTIDVDHEEGCEGAGKEECLARKTLEAHEDYIYTQKRTHPPPKP